MDETSKLQTEMETRKQKSTAEINGLNRQVSSGCSNMYTLKIKN